MHDYSQEFFSFAPTVYLNCAYQGPFPRSTVERIHQAIELKCNPVRLESRHYFDITESVRERIAALVGARSSEIALTSSATQGIGIVLQGLRLKASDEVVISSANFPSNLFSWIHLRRAGVRVTVLDPADGNLCVEDVAAALTSRTRVLALDWVSYNSGSRIDLAALGELAHRHGSLFVVDGSQGVGALELDVQSMPVDALAVAGYKWLLGPYGTGFVYLNSHIQEQLDLQVVNWLSVEGSNDFDSLPIEEFTLPNTAKIFDVAETANFLNLYALDASLEFLQRVGVRTVTDHCTYLLEHLAEGVKHRGYRISAAASAQHRSTILCFQADSLGATEKIYEKLKNNHIAVSLRHGMIRVSPHLYNSESEIDHLLEQVE